MAKGKFIGIKVRLRDNNKELANSDVIFKIDFFNIRTLSISITYYRIYYDGLVKYIFKIFIQSKKLYLFY